MNTLTILFGLIALLITAGCQFHGHAGSTTADGHSRSNATSALTVGTFAVPPATHSIARSNVYA